MSSGQARIEMNFQWWTALAVLGGVKAYAEEPMAGKGTYSLEEYPLCFDHESLQHDYVENEMDEF